MKYYMMHGCDLGTISRDTLLKLWYRSTLKQLDSIRSCPINYGWEYNIKKDKYNKFFSLYSNKISLVFFFLWKEVFDIGLKGALTSSQPL